MARNRSITFDRFGLPDHAKRIREISDNLWKLTAQGVIDQGREFTAAHEKLANHGDGLWGKWVKEECKLTREAARQRMRAFEVFGELDCQIICQFHPTAMYDLAGLGRPIRRARERCIELAKAGRKVTAKKAKQLIQEGYDAERREDERQLEAGGKLEDGPGGKLEDGPEPKRKQEKPKGLAGVRRLQELWEAYLQAWDAYRRGLAAAKPMERRLHQRTKEKR
ncbi:MAG: DUF3102 domain-containing protein, partial [Planctomycetes bacterium]|nr:DUF3102 domain-containing protein [Planctomycetota bacterium]